MIKILIVDDQTVVCEGLRVILNAAPNMDVVGVAYDGAQALAVIPNLKPDLVLMDLKMPGMNGIHATRAIREQFPEIKVLVLTTYDEDEWVFDAIRSGAAGYMLKDSRREDILAAIEGTMTGETRVDPGVAKKLFRYVREGTAPNPDVADQFSERELEVLQLLAHGLSNADIADRLCLAEGTVRNYVSTIRSKLGAADRTQAAALAWRYGLVTPNTPLEDED
ncbi:MAG: response regulator transcription factor [Chloroflexi bacterium]|nr:response regulator transcription factor [Chloroflexota bacterium]